MVFIKIRALSPCDCLSGSEENLSDTFVRKVRKSETLKDADFRSHIERNKIPENPDDCDAVCGMHGLSFEIWNDISKEILLRKYKITSAISPKHKSNLCIVKFKPGSGVIKPTPEQLVYNEFHYDFYKNDSFSSEDLELIDMVKLIPS